MSSNDRPGAPSDLFSAWLNMARSQGEIWSAAWKDVLVAEYGPGDWLRDLEKVHGLQLDAARMLLGYPSPEGVEDEATVCVNFEIDASRFDSSALRRKTKTKRFDPSSSIYATELRPLAAGRFQLRMEATAVSAEHVLVEIIEAVEVRSEGAVRVISVRDALKDARIAGRYLGLVSSRGRGETPLVVVNLSIRGKQS